MFVLLSASFTGSPSFLADKGNLSTSSNNVIFIGLLANPEGEFAPTNLTYPPGNIFSWTVPDSLLLTFSTRTLRIFVSLNIGSTLSFENDLASSTVGCTKRIGQGSKCIYLPKIFNSNSVFPTCAELIMVIDLVMLSVTQSNIAFIYGVLSVSHLPASAELSLESTLYLSAHSAIVKSSGGVKLSFTIFSIRCIVCFPCIIFFNSFSFFILIINQFL